MHLTISYPYFPCHAPCIIQVPFIHPSSVTILILPWSCINSHFIYPSDHCFPHLFHIITLTSLATSFIRPTIACPISHLVPPALLAIIYESDRFMPLVRMPCPCIIELSFSSFPLRGYIATVYASDHFVPLFLISNPLHHSVIMAWSFSSCDAWPCINSHVVYLTITYIAFNIFFSHCALSVTSFIIYPSDHNLPLFSSCSPRIAIVYESDHSIPLFLISCPLHHTSIIYPSEQRGHSRFALALRRNPCRLSIQLLLSTFFHIMTHMSLAVSFMRWTSINSHVVYPSNHYFPHFSHDPYITNYDIYLSDNNVPYFSPCALCVTN